MYINGHKWVYNEQRKHKYPDEYCDTHIKLLHFHVRYVYARKRTMVQGYLSFIVTHQTPPPNWKVWQRRPPDIYLCMDVALLT